MKLWFSKMLFFLFQQGRGGLFIGNMQGGDSDEVSDVLTPIASFIFIPCAETSNIQRIYRFNAFCNF